MFSLALDCSLSCLYLRGVVEFVHCTINIQLLNLPDFYAQLVSSNSRIRNVVVIVRNPCNPRTVFLNEENRASLNSLKKSVI